MQTNNKLREALIQIYDRVNSLDENCGVDPVEIRDIARAALAAPPRNCDIGTAEEQTKRKMEFCYKQGGCSNCSFSRSATLTQCALAWAQMPYEPEEGGAK